MIGQGTGTTRPRPGSKPLAGRHRPRRARGPGRARATSRSSAGRRSWSSPGSAARSRPTPASSSRTPRPGSTAKQDRWPGALEDPTFAGRVESVGADLSYRVEFARPRAARPSTRSRSSSTPRSAGPTRSSSSRAYTALETKIVEDIRHVTAVEGTELTLTFHLNKEVAEAKLVDEKGQATPLAKLEPGDESNLTPRRSPWPTRTATRSSSSRPRRPQAARSPPRSPSTSPGTSRRPSR